MSETKKVREWTIFDNDEYGPAWNGPRFELPPDAIVLTRERLQEAVRRRLPETWAEGGADTLESEIFGEAE